MRSVRRLLTAYACGAIATGLPWPLLLVLVWDRYADGPHGALAGGLVGAAEDFGLTGVKSVLRRG